MLTNPFLKWRRLKSKCLVSLAAGSVKAEAGDLLNAEQGSRWDVMSTQVTFALLTSFRIFVWRVPIVLVTRIIISEIPSEGTQTIQRIGITTTFAEINSTLFKGLKSSKQSIPFPLILVNILVVSQLPKTEETLLNPGILARRKNTCCTHGTWLVPCLHSAEMIQIWLIRLYAEPRRLETTDSVVGSNNTQVPMLPFINVKLNILIIL